VTFEAGLPKSACKLVPLVLAPVGLAASVATGDIGNAVEEVGDRGGHPLCFWGWRALLRYSEEGHIEIDNNSAERVLRAIALGRKNYLLAGSDSGGERAAAIYSLIDTAKLNGLDREVYLREACSASRTIPSTASRSCRPGTFCRNRQRKDPRVSLIKQDRLHSHTVKAGDVERANRFQRYRQHGLFCCVADSGNRVPQR
jgi:hypothetical protein